MKTMKTMFVITLILFTNYLVAQEYLGTDVVDANDTPNSGNSINLTGSGSYCKNCSASVNSDNNEKFGSIDESENSRKTKTTKK